jgi:Peptidase family M28
MKLSTFSNALPRTFVIFLFALLFISILLDIAQSAATHPLPQQSSIRATPTVFGNPTLIKRYQQTITPEALASRLYFLASDLFEGRETTTRGQKLAAQYLASQYRLMGLEPKGNAKDVDTLSPAAYFQPFTVYRRTPKETHLDVSVGGNRVASSTFSANAHDDLSYFLSGKIADATGGVVFAGYGIADDQLGYNDYAALKAQGISIDGKWVMVLDDEPIKDAKTSLLPSDEHKLTRWSATLLPKKKAILDAGRPAGVLVVEHESPLMQGTFAENAERASQAAQRIGPLSLTESPFPPTYAISSKLANKILAASGQTVEGLKQQINQTLKPVVFDVKDAVVNSTAERSKALESENVLAFIEGSDPQLKDEVVIISAHYDHLGLDPALKGDQIFNGAADDGSGIVASLELARAFMQARRDGYGPRRSVLFINFAGEEKGLLGSTFYTSRQPLIPLEKTVADINMDGVGGIDLKHPTHSKNYIYINGTKELSSELVEINKRIKETVGSNLELTDGPGFNSDNRSFSAQLVPFIYYSTGLTEHYHTTGDEPNTIDYDHLARVVQLVFDTAWQVANQNERVKGVNRSELEVVGYVCPPCPFECDTVVYDHDGECPVCGMPLAPKYAVRKSE